MSNALHVKSGTLCGVCVDTLERAFCKPKVRMSHHSSIRCLIYSAQKGCYICYRILKIFTPAQLATISESIKIPSADDVLREEDELKVKLGKEPTITFDQLVYSSFRVGKSNVHYRWWRKLLDLRILDRRIVVFVDRRLIVLIVESLCGVTSQESTRVGELNFVGRHAWSCFNGSTASRGSLFKRSI